MPWYRHSPQRRASSGRVSATTRITDTYLNIFHKFDMLDALEHAIHLRTIKAPSKGPAITIWTAHKGIQVAVECLLSASLHFRDQGWVAALRYMQLGLHGN